MPVDTRRSLTQPGLPVGGWKCLRVGVLDLMGGLWAALRKYALLLQITSLKQVEALEVQVLGGAPAQGCHRSMPCMWKWGPLSIAVRIFLKGPLEAICHTQFQEDQGKTRRSALCSCSEDSSLTGSLVVAAQKWPDRSEAAPDCHRPHSRLRSALGSVVLGS